MTAQIVPMVTVFVLALAVGFGAATLWSMYGSGAKVGASRSTASKSESARLAALEAAGKILHTEITQLREMIERTASAKLLAEVDDLAGALDSLRTANRREFGKIWGRLRGQEPESDGEATEVADRDKLRAQYLRPPGLGGGQ